MCQQPGLLAVLLFVIHLSHLQRYLSDKMCSTWLHDLHAKVQQSYWQGDWSKILTTLEEAGPRSCEVLWIRPDQDDLEFIRKAVTSQGQHKVISIGCGCGLLEWLIQAATGIPVVGLEIDPAYWNSKYFTRSKLKYIPLVFPEDQQFEDVFFDSRAALLFCYFNNRCAFDSYIDRYKGQCVIVIGPGLNSGRHTDPQPFAVAFKSNDWKLVSFKEIRDTKDFIAVYVRGLQS